VNNGQEWEKGSRGNPHRWWVKTLYKGYRNPVQIRQLMSPFTPRSVAAFCFRFKPLLFPYLGLTLAAAKF
jgi:hypothetical protein